MTKAHSSLFVLVVAAVSLTACSGEGATSAGLSHEAQAAQDSHDAHDAHDAHAAHDGAVPAAPGGALWPTDEPLRTGMARIEAAVERAHGMAQPMSRDEADALARTVEENVTYLIRNCKLPLEPDAALHVLIARMMAAAGQLKNEATAGAAVTQLGGVLREYRAAFDHAQPGPGAS